jgi:hypothetical protein
MIHGEIILYTEVFLGGESYMSYGPVSTPVIVHIKSSTSYYMFKDEKLVKIGKKIKKKTP